MQIKIFEEAKELEKSVLSLSNTNDKKKALTDFTISWGEKVVKEAWKLGDLIWTLYDEKF